MDINVMRDFTTELQTYCHDGNSHHKIKVKVLDNFYEINAIKKVEDGNETYFVIETEVSECQK